MNDWIVSLLILGALSSQGGSMPFWATANSFGVMPDSNGGLGLLQVEKGFDESKTLQWRAGVSAGLRTDKVQYKDFLLDELYGSLRWKHLRLDAGLWHPERYFMAADPHLGSLSVTGGHSIMSGNARSMPGYSLSLEPWDIPFTKGHLQLGGSFGDYFAMGPRYVSGVMAHNTALYLKWHIGKHITLTGGADNYTLWGGVSPTDGVFKKSFGNYLRVISGMAGGADAQAGERQNALGDHRGCEIFAFEYKSDGWSLSLQHDIPYDDKSGLIFRNFPDGINTACFSFKDKTGWVSDIVYEYANTMYQGGDRERRIATEEDISSGSRRLYTDPATGTVYYISGGADNYYNNYLFRSGWTNYGRTVGIPLFFPRGTVEGTWSRSSVTMGVWSNLLKAHHLGLSGSLFHILPYKLMLTYSENYGTFLSEGYSYDSGSRLEVPLRQFSSALMVEVPLYGGIIKVVPSLYYDRGEVLGENIAAILSIKYSFVKPD